MIQSSSTIVTFFEKTVAFFRIERVGGEKDTASWLNIAPSCTSPAKTSTPTSKHGSATCTPSSTSAAVRAHPYFLPPLLTFSRRHRSPHHRLQIHQSADPRPRQHRVQETPPIRHHSAGVRDENDDIFGAHRCRGETERNIPADTPAEDVPKEVSHKAVWGSE